MSPDRPLRLFVAVYPSELQARAILDLLRPLELSGHRPTAVESLHITVHFIGDTQPRELDTTVESVERAASGLPGFELRPVRLITLPERGPPRLVALETDAPPPLLELHRRLVRRLARVTPDRRSSGRFLPHFTLCRFAHDTRAVRLEQEVDLPPSPIREVRLMSSTLTPAGARHVLVRSFALQEPDRRLAQ